MAVADHLIAHTRGGARSLLEHSKASWIWTRLRAGFPDALSCVLMPDHLHLVAPPGGHTRVVRVLARFTARFGVRFDVIAEVANTAEIAARMIRYGFHNPARDGLVADPYAWRWSTLRDLVGAAHPIWTSPRHVAGALQLRPERVLRQVTHIADLRPVRPEFTGSMAVGIDALRDAVSAALRIDDPSRHWLGRRLVVQSACTIGRMTTATLATELGCSHRTIERARVGRAPGLSAVLLCLADARLRHTAAPGRGLGV